MKLSTILAAVDVSEESRIAVEQAFNIARYRGARLVLLHVGAIPQHPQDVPDALRSTLAAYERALQEHLVEDRRLLVELCEHYSGQGVEVSTMLVDDLPDQGICHAARQIDADLVAAGSHGRTGAKRLLLGSVAERVVRLSDCNVLIARPCAGQAAGGYCKLLVAMDFSVMAEEGLRAAIALATPEASIDIVHCWYAPPVSHGHFPSTRAMLELSQPLRKYITELGDALAARHQRPGLAMTFHMIEAPPAQGIIEWLDRGGYDLTVVGSHGHRGMRRFLLGSVAEAIVRHAPTSILVVHGTATTTARPNHART
jgi:nucleotide-binding universal stress UspA family protein